MTRVVVDASIVGAIVLNETTDEALYSVVVALRGGELILAAHSLLEAASILVKAARRQRATLLDQKARLDRVERLLAKGAMQPSASLRTVFDLAMATGLTAYDAVYLELALRLDATLATNDDALIVAARARGVPVLTTRP